jgi:hypothetical protein
VVLLDTAAARADDAKKENKRKQQFPDYAGLAGVAAVLRRFPLTVRSKRN